MVSLLIARWVRMADDRNPDVRVGAQHRDQAGNPADRFRCGRGGASHKLLPAQFESFLARSTRREPVDQLAANASLLRHHRRAIAQRSEEHTSELQSLMRISY